MREDNRKTESIYVRKTKSQKTAASFTGDAHRQQLFTLLQCFLHLLKLDL